jgi:hypothetical protein
MAPPTPPAEPRRLRQLRRRLIYQALNPRCCPCPARASPLNCSRQRALTALTGAPCAWRRLRPPAGLWPGAGVGLLPAELGHLRGLLSELGASPASRGRVQGARPAAAPAANPWDVAGPAPN